VAAGLLFKINTCQPVAHLVHSLRLCASQERQDPSRQDTCEVRPHR
jgi:hypothetical protein